MITSEDLATKHGMMSVKEVALLKKCAKLIPEESVVVNIGAGFGTSAAAILEVRPNAYVYSVDMRPKPEEAQNLALCGIDVRRCVRILGCSWKLADKFPHAIDLLFVDGEHTNEAVKNDIDAWVPKVRLGGIVAFHDYDHYNVPGLKVVVDNAMKRQLILGKERFLIVYQLINAL